MALDIVAIGHLINETIVYPGKKSRSVLGSPVAYSMACAAALGKQVGIVARIGEDYPHSLLDPLIELGVNLNGVVSEGPASTVNVLEYDDQGSKTIRYLSRAPAIESKDVPVDYCDARMFYACPMDWDMNAETVSWLRGRGGLVAGDLGGFGGAHSPLRDTPQIERDSGAMREVISSLTIVKASDEDCRRIVGRDDLDIESFSQQLIEWGAEIAVITLGSAGALVVTASDRWRIPALPGDPIDPTGGGDTFMAGFLVNYLDSNDPQEAGHFGAATALYVIERTGGVTAGRMPRMAQVSARLGGARGFAKK